MGSSGSMVLALVVALVVRYFRLFVGIVMWASCKPIPIPDKPTCTSKDATCVVPTTFKDPAEVMLTLAAIASCDPRELVVVTSNANVKLVEAAVAVNCIGAGRDILITVLGVPKLNKKTQMIRALQEIDSPLSPLCVFCDDDVIWPKTFLLHLLAVFEDPKVGAGGTRQRVIRNDKPDIWNFLGICYLERRAFNNITTWAVDGSVSTLSGRTSAFRTSILKNDDFFGKFSGTDDKFLTKFLYSHGWQIGIQTHDDAILKTTLESEPGKFLAQNVRWSRGRFSGNMSVMRHETYWFTTHLWGLWCIYITQFQPPSIIVDSFLLYLVFKAFGCSALAFTAFFTFLILTKIVKLVPHFLRHPSDVQFIPGAILFGYAHGFYHVWGFLTMYNSAWGNHDLKKLETVRATEDEVVPLLKGTQTAVSGYSEPTPGKVVLEMSDDNSYFSIQKLRSVRTATLAQ